MSSVNVVTVRSLPRTADAIDVTATMTNVRTTCDDSGEKVYATATFDVLGLRRDTRGARTVTLPYFTSVVRGGNAVTAKRVGTVTLNQQVRTNRGITVRAVDLLINTSGLGVPLGAHVELSVASATAGD